MSQDPFILLWNKLHKHTSYAVKYTNRVYPLSTPARQRYKGAPINPASKDVWLDGFHGAELVVSVARYFLFRAVGHLLHFAGQSIVGIIEKNKCPNNYKPFFSFLLLNSVSFSCRWIMLCQSLAWINILSLTVMQWSWTSCPHDSSRRARPEQPAAWWCTRNVLLMPFQTQAQSTCETQAQSTCEYRNAMITMQWMRRAQSALSDATVMAELKKRAGVTKYRKIEKNNSFCHLSFSFSLVY